MAKLGVKERAALFESVYGLVHPFTNLPTSRRVYDEAYGRYTQFIEEAAESGNPMVFVGTLPEKALAEFVVFDEKTHGSLRRVRELSEAERRALKNNLARMGVVSPESRYEILEEASLLLNAVERLPAERLHYNEGKLDARQLKRKFDGKTNPKKVNVIFAGERPDVCVRDNKRILKNALGIYTE